MNATQPRFVASGILLAMAILAVVVAQPTRANAQQSSGMDHPIVQAGLQHLGGHGGQCYMFAFYSILNATGANIGMGYRQGYLDAGGVEVDPDYAQAGDVLQISNPSDQSSYYPGMHTVIVIENHGNRNYTVIDSNWNWDETVRIHEWSPRPASHLKLYAYRFSTETAPAQVAAPAADAGVAPALSVGSAATVDTGDSCLNLRASAGLDGAILDCLPHGEAVTVLSEATAAGGYTWYKVRASSGMEGWVAAEYLAAGGSVSTEAPGAVLGAVAPEAAPSAFPIGGFANVSADGDCLYIRDDAGFGGAILNCLPDGSSLRILSELVPANGYSWVRVETSTGARGWVASEYVS